MREQTRHPALTAISATAAVLVAATGITLALPRSASAAGEGPAPKPAATSSSSGSSQPSDPSSSASASPPPTKQTIGPLAYGCMLLGEKVRISVSYTIPASLVGLASRPVAGGPRLKTLLGGTGAVRTQIKLSRAAVQRLRLVDITSIGGENRAKVAFGSSAMSGTFAVKKTKLRPAADGTQTVNTSVRMGKLEVVTPKGRKTVEAMHLPTKFDSSMFISRFPHSACTIRKKAKATPALRYTVLPATVKAKAKASAGKVAVTAADGLGHPGVGPVTATVTAGKAKGTMSGALSGGKVTFRFGPWLKSHHASTGVVRVSYGGITSGKAHVSR